MNRIYRISLFLLSVFFPFLVILSAIRLALTPVFVTLEYRLPGFPPDPFGFSTTDRLHWANYSIRYLLGNISHQELSAQVLVDGSALFNQRELSHMADVQRLTTAMLYFWAGLIVLLVLTMILSIRIRSTKELFAAIKSGIYLTLMALGVVLLYVWINFDLIFTKFHELFFEGDSWLFLPSDNLIRLFPIRFWRDIFIFIGVVSILGCIFFLLFAYFSSFHNKKAQN